MTKKLCAILLMIALCLTTSFASANVGIGDTVSFGTYPQQAGGNDRTPIRWIVINVDWGSQYSAAA